MSFAMLTLQLQIPSSATEGAATTLESREAKAVVSIVPDAKWLELVVEAPLGIDLSVYPANSSLFDTFAAVVSSCQS